MYKPHFVYTDKRLSLLFLTQRVLSVTRYLDVFLRRVMTDNIVFSPRRRAFVNKPGQAFRAEEYTDVKGMSWTFTEFLHEVK